jgi:hypothetical protein
VLKLGLILMVKNSFMNRPLILLAFVVAVSPVCHAQYYYKDIISNRQLLEEMARLKEQKIHTISIKSFEDDGSPSDGFFCERRLNRNYTRSETLNKSNVTGSSVLVAEFDRKGFLLKSTDSSEIAVNTSSYGYDGEGRITRIRSSVRSSDDDFTNEIVEDHVYEYDDKGNLLRMVRVKNGTDSSFINFSPDEHNNVAIEKDSRSGATYYYYYDNKKRLTDVVHLNPFNQQMLPDYLFEYNAAGQVSQMTNTEEGGSYYFVWRYSYDNGLRTKEQCFSKEKRLMGTIDYEYK